MLSTTQEAEIEDYQLVDAARVGCIQSFDLLVGRYHDCILAYLTRQTDDPELAADLTQETFLDAFRDIHRLNNNQVFAPWLYRIAYNNARGEWKRRRRHISLDTLERRGHAEYEIAARADQMMQCLDREIIYHVLGDLSPALRNALLLNSLLGFSSQEVADILRVSPAAVRQRIARAKEEFRRQYLKVGGDGHDLNF